MKFCKYDKYQDLKELDKVFEKVVKRGKYKRMDIEKKKILTTYFDNNPYPSNLEFLKFSKELNESVFKIENWFKHKRRMQQNNKEIKSLYKKRRNLSKSERETLEKSFRKNPNLIHNERSQLAKKLNLNPRFITNWFFYRREKLSKIKKSESKKKEIEIKIKEIEQEDENNNNLININNLLQKQIGNKNENSNNSKKIMDISPVTKTKEKKDQIINLEENNQIKKENSTKKHFKLENNVNQRNETNQSILNPILLSNTYRELNQSYYPFYSNSLYYNSFLPQNNILFNPFINQMDNMIKFQEMLDIKRRNFHQNNIFF